MSRPPVDFRVLRDMVGVRDVLALLAWDYSWHRGDEWRGPCPLHATSARRSRVFRAQGHIWYCHRCHRGGDALELWAATHPGQAKLEAAYELCAALGIAPPRLTAR